MSYDLNSKELALILFHAVCDSEKELYGQPVAAQRVIENHLQKLTDKAMKQKSYTSFTVSHMFDSFSRLGLRPPERFVKFLEDKAIEMLPEAKSDDIADMLKAGAKLGLPFGKGFFNAVQKRMPFVQASFAPAQVYETLHALAILDSVNALHNGSKRFQMGNIFGPMFGDPKVRQKLTGLDSDASRHMLLDTIYWFKGQKPFPYPRQPETNSYFEHEVSSAFARAGAQILPVKPDPDTHHCTDLSACFNQTVFAVECDGPTHFVRSLDDHKVFLDGSTIFQTALQTKRHNEQKLVRMPHDVFYRNVGNDEMFEYLLLEIEDAAPGSYLVGSSGGLIPLMSGYDSDLAFPGKPSEPA